VVHCPRQRRVNVVRSKDKEISLAESAKSREKKLDRIYLPRAGLQNRHDYKNKHPENPACQPSIGGETSGWLILSKQVLRCCLFQLTTDNGPRTGFFLVMF